MPPVQFPPPPLGVNLHNSLGHFFFVIISSKRNTFLSSCILLTKSERGKRGDGHIWWVWNCLCVCVCAHFNSRFDDHNGNSFNDRTCDDADNDDGRGAAVAELERDRDAEGGGWPERERDTSARAPQGNLNCGQSSCCSCCSCCCCCWPVLNGWVCPRWVQRATLHFLLA